MAVEKDKGVVVYEKKISPLVEKAKGFEIVDDKTMTVAVAMLSEMNLIGDSMEAEKKKITEPANLILKNERARWKPLESMYEEGIKILRATMSEYQTRKIREANEEKLKIAARVGEGKGKLKVETAIAQAKAVDTPDKKVESEVGSVRFQAVKHFEVEDFKKLPDEYKLSNDVKIRAAMREGKELPGVKYWENQEPINSR